LAEHWAEQNFEIFSGDTKIIVVDVVEGSGNPINLAGASLLEWVLKRAPGAKLPLIRKVIDSGITVTDASVGRFEIFLDAQDTEKLGGTYYHECDLIDALGNRSTIFYGYVVIK
jgi:hypothetical protein